MLQFRQKQRFMSVFRRGRKGRTGRAMFLALIHVILVLARQGRLEAFALNKVELTGQSMRV